MEKELMAEALEEFRDHLGSYHLGWMLGNQDRVSAEAMDAVRSFYEYACEKADEAIRVRRPGGSYEECRRRFAVSDDFTGRGPGGD